MTMAISKAAEEGAQAVICASTGNTCASAAAYAVRAGMVCAVLVPDGKIALGKMSQALAHGAAMLQVQGNFDDCLTLARDLSDHYPVALVNCVNPFRIEGQKTAAFEIVDVLGDAPDIHCLPVGNAGNITAYWKGYHEYAPTGWPLVCRGCGASRRPAPPRSSTASRSHARRPSRPRSGSATRRRGSRPSRRATSPAASSTRSPTGRSCARTGWLAAREGVFVEPASAASVAGLLQAHEAGQLDAGSDRRVHRHRARSQGPPVGHRRGAGPAGRARRRARGGRAARPGRLMAGAMFRAAPVRVRVPATAANLGPGLRRLRPGSGALRRRRRAGDRVRARRRGRRRGRRQGAHRTSGTSSSRRCARLSRSSAVSRVGWRCGAPTASRTAAGSGRQRCGHRLRCRRGPVAGRGRRPTASTTWPCSAGRRARGPPRQRRRMPAGRLHHRLDRTGRGPRGVLPGARRGRTGRPRPGDRRVHGQGAPDAARDRPVRRRCPLGRTGRPAQRRAHGQARPAAGGHRGPAPPGVPGRGDAPHGRPGRAAPCGRAAGCGLRGRADGARPGLRRHRAKAAAAAPRGWDGARARRSTPVGPPSCRWSR